MPFESPQPANEIVIERCDRTAGALQRLHRISVGLREQEPALPHFDALADFVIAVASEPETPWPQSTWPFLEPTVSIASWIKHRCGRWRDPTLIWDPGIIRLIAIAYGEIEKLRDPLRDPEPKTVQLESIEELVGLKLRDHQIAKIYGWWPKDGSSDDYKKAREKVNACKRGEVAAPITKTYPPSASVPERQPNLDVVHAAMALIASPYSENE